MRQLHVIILIFMLFVFSGCATSGLSRTSEAETPVNLEVASVLKFQDVPSPHGFKVVADDSFLFDNDVTRLGLIKYTGKPDALSVVRFYKDQMPLYNWRFVNLIEFNTRILNFDRDDQTCTIIITPYKLSTSIIVSVAPKAGRASTYKIEE